MDSFQMFVMALVIIGCVVIGYVMGMPGPDDTKTQQKIVYLCAERK